MESRAGLLEHSMYQMLIVLPLGVREILVAFDVRWVRG